MTPIICPTCQESFEPASPAAIATCPKCAASAQLPCAAPAPHRGETILTMGMLAVFVLPPVFGPVAWWMGRRDLARMRRGEMDPAGQGLTKTGWMCGIGATLVSAILLTIICVLVGLLIYLEWWAASLEVR